MQAVYVPPRITKLTFDQSRAALRWAFDNARTQAVPLQGLALGMAQSGLETGRWQKMWNFNFGNIKASEQYEGQFTCITLNEVLGNPGRLVWFAPEGELVAGPGSALKAPPVAVPDGHPQTRMRDYPNEYMGAADYVELLQKRFGPAFDAMLDGDAALFVRKLKERHYFTADEGLYLRGVSGLAREFETRLKGVPHEEVEVHADVFAEAERLRDALLWAA